MANKFIGLFPHPSLKIHNKVNYLPASGKVCRLLMIFANSLDPDQARQNVGPDLDPSCFQEKIFEKSNVEKYQQLTKQHA